MASTPNESIPMRLFLAGASNVIAASCSHPIDSIKVAFQLKGEGVGGVKPTFRAVASELVGQHGFVKGLYAGLFPSLLREATYSSLRLGMYEPAKGLVGADKPDAPFHLRLAAGLISGSTAAAITNWADVLKIRAQAAKHRASDQGSEIVRTWRTAVSIVKNEGGIPALWQGVGPNVQRAAILTACQVGTYDQTKTTIKQAGWLQEGLALHCAAAVVAGLVCAIATSPVDLAKSRIMNQKQRLAEAAAAGTASSSSTTSSSSSPLFSSARPAVPVAGVHSSAAASAAAAKPPVGELFYTGTLDCLAKTFRAEGLRGLYKGFTQQWLRLSPHTVITFIAYEKLRAMMGVKPM